MTEEEQKEIESLNSSQDQINKAKKDAGLIDIGASYYRYWLQKYLASNPDNQPSHFYNYNYFETMEEVAIMKMMESSTALVERGKLYKATKDFNVPALCGSNSISIIIPKGIKFTESKYNHCSFYYEDPALIDSSGAFIPSHNSLKT
jgi:hypothetical protein